MKLTFTHVTQARDGAANLHNLADQTYGKLPYVSHLDDVANTLMDFGFRPAIVPYLFVAAYMHDTIEDTSLSLDELKQMFGPSVADIVHRVTNEPGKNRKEKFAKTYPKIKGHREATIIKLADRIANTRHSAERRKDLFKMYKKEYPTFRQELYHYREDTEPMWEELDRLNQL
jgi:(p)ppGpp synthase/HD superfamily hydrolase